MRKNKKHLSIEELSERRHRRTRRGIIAGFILVFFSAFFLVWVAKGETRPFGSAENNLYGLAIDYWGGKKPYGCRRVDKQVVAPSRMSGLAGAALPPFNRTAPRGEYCYVGINKELLVDPYLFCIVLLHEVGHLKGRIHSTDPEDIMFSVVSPEIYRPACGPENRARYEF